jgi:hypothetical protein
MVMIHASSFEGFGVFFLICHEGRDWRKSSNGLVRVHFFDPRQLKLLLQLRIAFPRCAFAILHTNAPPCSQPGATNLQPPPTNGIKDSENTVINLKLCKGKLEKSHMP